MSRRRTWRAVLLTALVIVLVTAAVQAKVAQQQEQSGSEVLGHVDVEEPQQQHLAKEESAYHIHQDVEEEEHHRHAQPTPPPAKLVTPQDTAREADRLYHSALRILASLKARSELLNTAHSGADEPLSSSGHSRTTSTLLQPVSPTPFLDFLERHLTSRTKYLGTLVRLYSQWKHPKTAKSHPDDGTTQDFGYPTSASTHPEAASASPSPSTQPGMSSFLTRIGLKKANRIDRQTRHRAAVQTLVERLETSYRLGKTEAGKVLGDIHLWGRYGLVSNASKAFEYYTAVAEESGDPEAQYMLGFLHSSNYGQSAYPGRSEGLGGSQAASLLHYTFSALSGENAEAEMSLGYRSWVGIGVPQNCHEALPWYKSAAEQAMAHFDALDAPIGGRHLPPPKLRIADVQGGMYGPGASGTTYLKDLHNAQHHSGGAAQHHPTTEGEWADVLEFYQFHADRGDPNFMFRIGRIFYNGYNPIGSKNGGGSLETSGRDFKKARSWFMRIARSVWPRDPLAAYTNPANNHHATQNNGNDVVVGKSRHPSQSQLAYYNHEADATLKVDDHLALAAGFSAGYIGRMYLRGEGQSSSGQSASSEPDYAKAFLWFNRGIAISADRESHNGLGLMYRDGLGVERNEKKAYTHFRTAAQADLAEAEVNLGKWHYDRGEVNLATTHFESAIRHGDTFSSYFYLAEINAATLLSSSYSPLVSGKKGDLCPVATVYYKLVAERGDWKTAQPWWEAERAWLRGDKVKALLGYWMMAERGYEVAQNNVAWILDQEKRLLHLPSYDHTLSSIVDRLALIYFTRSAAQDNVDSLVKMGDYYLKGKGITTSLPAPASPEADKEAVLLPQPEKAAACYASAANTHVSALAMHNLGWMHELGLGVSQDFHLAKRYYDLSLGTSSEAYLPVTLSLLRLHLRSLYRALITGDIKSISLFLSPDVDLEDELDVQIDPVVVDAQGNVLEGADVPTELRRQIEEAQAKARRAANGGRGAGAGWGSLRGGWKKWRDEFFKRWLGEEMAKQRQRRIDDAGEGVVGNAPAEQHGQAEHMPQQDTAAAARAELEAPDDPVGWARRRREDLIQQANAQMDEERDELDLPDFFGDTLGARGGEGREGDDVLETVAILGLCLVLGWLVYIRQARYDNQRAAAAAVPQGQANPPRPTPGAVPETEEQRRERQRREDEQLQRNEPRP